MEVNKNKLKKHIYEACLKQIKDRLSHIEVAIQQAEYASIDDTKSSAGDKYETTREMMQQEIGRNHLQLIEAQKALFQLEKVKDVISENTVAPGSLIETNQGLFFLAISLGQMIMEEQKVIILSPVSPLGQILNEKNKSESFTFNGIYYTINNIY